MHNCDEISSDIRGVGNHWHFRVARRGFPHGSALGAKQWGVERTIAWLHGFRRLRIRWERRDDIHEAFLGLATCLTAPADTVQRLCYDLLQPGLGTACRRTTKSQQVSRKCLAAVACSAAFRLATGGSPVPAREVSSLTPVLRARHLGVDIPEYKIILRTARDRPRSSFSG
ncbi:hypothetical protein SSAG_02689 [Streptomyces sp. Mg1]|nr:hypothetical protein SSAG_02689 [Streptomyces sp. Mg1]